MSASKQCVQSKYCEYITDSMQYLCVHVSNTCVHTWLRLSTYRQQSPRTSVHVNHSLYPHVHTCQHPSHVFNPSSNVYVYIQAYLWASQKNMPTALHPQTSKVHVSIQSQHVHIQPSMSAPTSKCCRHLSLYQIVRTKSSASRTCIQP